MYVQWLGLAVEQMNVMVQSLARREVPDGAEGALQERNTTGTGATVLKNSYRLR